MRSLTSECLCCRRTLPIAHFARAHQICRNCAILSANEAVIVAIANMEKLFDMKIMLKLWVKVKSGWSDDERALRSLGYNDL